MDNTSWDTISSKLHIVFTFRSMDVINISVMIPCTLLKSQKCSICSNTYEYTLSEFKSSLLTRVHPTPYVHFSIPPSFELPTNPEQINLTSLSGVSSRTHLYYSLFPPVPIIPAHTNVYLYKPKHGIVKIMLKERG